MSQINVRNLSNENDDGAPDIVGVSTFSSTAYIVPPVGTTGQRPSNSQPGDLRFNTDSASLEYYRGDILGWSHIEMTSPDLGGLGASTGSNKGTGARALFWVGQTPSNTDRIDAITISTMGSKLDFGNNIDPRQRMSCCASNTRGIGAMGYTSSFETGIRYVTFSSTGDTETFGTVTGGGRNRACGASNQTRGLFIGGNPTTDNITYITIAATGNSQDFGNLTVGRQGLEAMTSSTRAVVAGGWSDVSPYNPGTYLSTVDYVTISTTGNALDFSDTTTNAVLEGAACSNSTRGLFSGGYTPGPTRKKNIDHFTLATLGSVTDFGDLNVGRSDHGAASSPTRAIFGGGTNPAVTDTIESVQFASTGSYTSFGTLTLARTATTACSNAHGGL